MRRSAGMPFGLCSLLFLAWSQQAPAQDELGKKERKHIDIKWAEPFETGNYAVEYQGTLQRAVVKRVADAIEEVLGQYALVFKFKPETKLKVKYLDSQDAYEQEGGDPRHLGHYNPGTRYLVLRDMPFYDLIPTAYHEAFHQYLAEYVGHGTPIPTWFNEGMAMYFEGIQTNKKTKKLDYKLIDNRKLGMVQRALQTRSALPLEKLVDAGYEEFHDKEKESLHYNQSLAFIYYLMQGKGGKPAFQFADELKKTKDVDKANEKLFGKERKGLKQAETQWKAYTLQVQLTAQPKA